MPAFKPDGTKSESSVKINSAFALKKVLDSEAGTAVGRCQLRGKENVRYIIEFRKTILPLHCIYII